MPSKPYISTVSGFFIFVHFAQIFVQKQQSTSPSTIKIHITAQIFVQKNA
jgi:hypothetical protein